MKETENVCAPIIFKLYRGEPDGLSRRISKYGNTWTYDKGVNKDGDYIWKVYDSDKDKEKTNRSSSINHQHSSNILTNSCLGKAVDYAARTVASIVSYDPIS